MRQTVTYCLYRWAQWMTPSVHKAFLYFCVQSKNHFFLYVFSYWIFCVGCKLLPLSQPADRRFRISLGRAAKQSASPFLRLHILWRRWCKWGWGCGQEETDFIETVCIVCIETQPRLTLWYREEVRAFSCSLADNRTQTETRWSRSTGSDWGRKKVAPNGRGIFRNMGMMVFFKLLFSFTCRGW